MSIIQSIVLVCDTCRLEVPVEESRRFIRVNRSGAGALVMLTSFGWCGRCWQVGPCESIPGLDELEVDMEIARQAEGDPGAVNMLSVDEVIELVRWRKGRVSPPRCLSCGSTNVTAASLSNQGSLVVPHQGCSGRLVSQGVHYRDGAMTDVLLDEEGNQVDGEPGAGGAEC